MGVRRKVFLGFGVILLVLPEGSLGLLVEGAVLHAFIS